MMRNKLKNLVTADKRDERRAWGGDKEINALISYKQINHTDIYEYVEVQKFSSQDKQINSWIAWNQINHTDIYTTRMYIGIQKFL